MSPGRHDTNFSFSLSGNLLLPHLTTVTVLLHWACSLHHGRGCVTPYIVVLT